MLAIIHIMNNQYSGSDGHQEEANLVGFPLLSAFLPKFCFFSLFDIAGSEVGLGYVEGRGLARAAGDARGSCPFTATLGGVMWESPVS